MDNTTSVPSVKSYFENESSVNSVASVVKHSTDCSHHFDSDNKHSADAGDQNECEDNVTNVTVTAAAAAITPTNKKFTASLATKTSHLTKDSIIYFDDFNNKTTILSPISELSFNVAWTKLVSTSDVTGK